MQSLTLSPTVIERLLERAQKNGITIEALLVQYLDRQTEQALTQTNEILESILDSVTDVMSAVTLPERKLLYISESAVRLYGVPLSAFYHNPGLTLQMVHPDDQGTLLAALEQVDDREVATCDYRIVRADGDIRWVRCRAWMLRDAAGTPIRLVQTTSDITKEKWSESQHQILRTALESAANAVVITDRDSVIEWANPAFTRLTGYSLEESINQKMGQLVRSGLYRPDFYKEIWETILAGKVWSGRIVNRRKDGELYTEEQTIAPVLDDKGNILRFVSIKQDITEREYAEQLALDQERLRATLAKEEEYNAYIKQAISSLMHDIRTPLAAILTSKEILTHYYDQLNGEQRRAKLEGIGMQLRLLTELLNDLTRVLGTSINQHQFNPTVVNLPALCRLIVQELGTLSSSKHRIHVTTGENIRYVMLDEILISRILLNLLTNSVKYSPNGGDIRLDISLHNEMLVFKVIDQGLGISDNELPYIFEPLYRANTNLPIPGTGLGLSITRECVVQHQGSIEVHSQLGHGSTFIVSIPYVHAEAQPEAYLARSLASMKSTAKRITGTMRSARPSQ